MNPKIMFAVTAGLGLVLASGCGSAAKNSVGVTPRVLASSRTPSPSAGPGGTTVVRTVHASTPFTITLKYSLGQGQAKWRISLAAVDCGATTFKPAIIRADEASMGEPYSMPAPSTGQKFCLATLMASNESTSNQNWQAYLEATLNVGNDAYSAYQPPGTSEDPASAYRNWAAHHGESDTAFGVNPGVSGVDYAVYEIPISARPTSASVLASAYASGPVVLVMLVP